MRSSDGSGLQPHSYFIRHAGNESGPFDIDRLRQMWADSEVDYTTKFRRADWNYWGDAEDLLVELEFRPPPDETSDSDINESTSESEDMAPPQPAIVEKLTVGASSFKCPHCRDSFRMPNELLGEEIGCPLCSGLLIMPAPAALREAKCLCPFCAEEIFAAAVKCKHCGEFLDGRSASTPTAAPQPFQHTTGLPRCQQCGGEMKKKTISSGNCAGLVLALIVFCVGVAITIAFLPFGLIVGPLVCLFALFMGGKRSKVWKCVKCGSIVNRA